MIELYPGALHSMSEDEAKALGVSTPQDTVKQFTTAYILELEKKTLRDLAYRQADLDILQTELKNRLNTNEGQK